jgi:hypothetical protein
VSIFLEKILTWSIISWARSGATFLVSRGRFGWQGLCLRRGECFYISTNLQNRKRKVARLGHKMSDFAICKLVDCWHQKKGWKICKCAIHKLQLRKSGTPYCKDLQEEAANVNFQNEPIQCKRNVRLWQESWEVPKRYGGKGQKLLEARLEKKYIGLKLNEMEGD